MTELANSFLATALIQGDSDGTLLIPTPGVGRGITILEVTIACGPDNSGVGWVQATSDPPDIADVWATLNTSITIELRNGPPGSIADYQVIDLFLGSLNPSYNLTKVIKGAIQTAEITDVGIYVIVYSTATLVHAADRKSVV